MKSSRGSEIKQSYTRVRTGDLVYNPHRVNVGSLGLVSKELDGGIVSGIYVVFRPIDPERLPPEYLLHLLKSEAYLEIIRAYDTKYGAVRPNLNWEQLCRIKVPVPGTKQIRQFSRKQLQYSELKERVNLMEKELSKMVEPKKARTTTKLSASET